MHVIMIFVLLFGNTISIPHRNTQNVVNIVGIQLSFKTNAKNTKKKTKKTKTKKTISVNHEETTMNFKY
jgi:ACT domain-containing protein